MGQFMDGQAMHESGTTAHPTDNYAYYKAATDSKNDLLGRFSIRRYNWIKWCTQFFGAVRDWQVAQYQDMVTLHLFEVRFAKYRLAFPDESRMQIWQRVAAWWKLPAYAGDTDPRTTWTKGLKSYVRYAGEAINKLGYEGWTSGEGWLA
jgi:hypothetical protein